MTLELPDLVPGEPRQPSRWEIFAVLVTALATLAVGFAGAKPYIQALLAAATVLIAAGLWYAPLLAFLSVKRKRSRSNKIARKSWLALLRFERRFAEFLNAQDIRNLRYIINEISGRQDEELYKCCPPDYLGVFFSNLLGRHTEARRVREAAFRSAVTEFIAMVASYNSEYVLRPLQRLRGSQRFQQLPSQDRRYREEAIEAFRERWVLFLDNFAEFIAAYNDEVGYEPYHEAIPAYFDRPKRPAVLTESSD